MLLDQLSLKEKHAFLSLAKQLVSLNGIEEEERAMLEAACREMGITANVQEEATDIVAVSACFESERSRRIALLELYLLCHADGEIQSAEREYNAQVCRAMGMEEEIQERASRLSQSMLDLYLTANRFVASAF